MPRSSGAKRLWDVRDLFFSVNRVNTMVLQDFPGTYYIIQCSIICDAFLLGSLSLCASSWMQKPLSGNEMELNGVNGMQRLNASKWWAHELIFGWNTNSPSRGLGPAERMNKFQVEGLGWTLWTLKRGHFNSSSKNKYVPTALHWKPWYSYGHSWDTHGLSQWCRSYKVLPW